MVLDFFLDLFINVKSYFYKNKIINIQFILYTTSFCLYTLFILFVRSIRFIRFAISNIEVSSCCCYFISVRRFSSSSTSLSLVSFVRFVHSIRPFVHCADIQHTQFFFIFIFAVFSSLHSSSFLLRSTQLDFNVVVLLFALLVCFV